MKVGIIGGTGGMGRLFSRIFQEAGHDVMVSGRTTSITNEYIAKHADLIIVSVPIRDTIPVIDSIAPHVSSEQILTDLTSLKTGPVQAMLATKARVIGLHPMFGPSIASLHGQTIIATPARYDDKDLDLLKRLFEAQGARVTITTPEEHDRMMAVIQGLTHFKAILFAGTMRRLGITPSDTESYISPVYRIETGIAGRLLSQNADLYADILCMNPSVPDILAVSRKAADELERIILSGDKQAFSDEFNESKEWFGPFCDKASRETDLLIQAMVKE